MPTTDKPRALTIRQPWAGAIVHLTKRVENRTWKLPAKQHGARILIHAGAQLDPNATIYGPNLGVYGAIIGTATLTDCHWSDDGQCCGPWGFENAYHWTLDNVTALAVPVPCKGALSFWTPPADVLHAIHQQLEQEPTR
ncbi:ASCH domain-containing protein [Streptomyces sp. Wb2n-11]|uniref:ASCH domain-containing protein n=1 Tax=Streptomyces sp. Wb2n-11 TaxID=1030533 RepID=UPI000AF019AD|nr:ASCH domain-containing protein [Streptomyces sp. Wb2n-11]